MLESIKDRGDLVAAHRPTVDSIYIEGTVKKAFQDGEDYFYEIAWEDGKHFGEMFYEGELDEIDVNESEALLRVSLSDFLDNERLDEWLNTPNSKIRSATPLEALNTIGLRKVLTIALDDYEDALRRSLQRGATTTGDSQLEDQLGEIFKED